MAHARPTRPAAPRDYLGVFRYGARALALVWSHHPWLTVVLALLTLVAGTLPAAAAWVGKWIVDGVVAAVEARSRGETVELDPVLWAIGAEAGIAIALAASQRALSVCESLLRAQLGHRVNVMILEKALTLSVANFDDSEFYDRLTRARREASSRPVSLVLRTFGLIQNAISLVSYGALLWAFSPLAVVVLVVAGLPSFVAEAKFSGDAFQLFRWRSPFTRKQMYLETVLAREDYVKEVKIYGLGRMLLDRYREIFHELYREDRRLTVRRGVWGGLLGLLGTATFYGAYVWIGMRAVEGAITLGSMTMYLALFRQGQSAISAMLSSIARMYEDNLYLSNLFEFLETPMEEERGERVMGPKPGDGIRFENVSFRYPGSKTPALDNVTLHIPPGHALALVGENGSGKSTLIKLLARLYSPTSGRVTLDGLDLQEWDTAALRRRLAVAFQDFARYQFSVGENIGAGDVASFEDEDRWEQAGEAGMAASFVEDLPQRYHTQLGRWFDDGRELSGGQWQKVALSRGFMRTRADVLVLDEPTAAMDAEAEAQVFDHVRRAASDKIVVLISHRFSTVRMADDIVVMDHGRVIERGSHESLMREGGTYAHLFELQAKGYR